MTSHIAYPNELLDDTKLTNLYDKLEMGSDNYLRNALNLTVFGTNYSFKKLREPVNKTDWVTHGRPAVVNAYYSPLENSIRTHHRYLLMAIVSSCLFFQNFPLASCREPSSAKIVLPI